MLGGLRGSVFCDQEAKYGIVDLLMLRAPPSIMVAAASAARCAGDMRLRCRRP